MINQSFLATTLGWFKMKALLCWNWISASNFGLFHALFSYFYGGGGQQTAHGSNTEAE